MGKNKKSEGKKKQTRIIHPVFVLQTQLYNPILSICQVERSRDPSIFFPLLDFTRSDNTFVTSLPQLLSRDVLSEYRIYLINFWI